MQMSQKYKNIRLKINTALYMQETKNRLNSSTTKTGPNCILNIKHSNS